MPRLDLPAGGKDAKVTAAEMNMAEQLVGDMSGKWNPGDFKDEFKHAVMKIVDRKVKAGDTETVIQPEERFDIGCTSRSRTQHFPL